SYYVPPRALHSFPTRRSSDLNTHARRRIAIFTAFAFLEAPGGAGTLSVCRAVCRAVRGVHALSAGGQPGAELARHGRSAINTVRDRKSTRLNSSHVKISYAVF